MVKCPICKEELSKKTKDGWLCSHCGEEIPQNYSDDSKPRCGCSDNFR